MRVVVQQRAEADRENGGHARGEPRHDVLVPFERPELGRRHVRAALDDGEAARHGAESTAGPTALALRARRSRVDEREHVPRHQRFACALRRDQRCVAGQHHAIRRAQQRRQPDVDQIDVGQREDHVGVEHHALAQQVVDQVEQRRLVVVDDAGDVAGAAAALVFGAAQRRLGRARRARRGFGGLRLPRQRPWNGRDARASATAVERLRLGAGGRRVSWPVVVSRAVPPTKL